MQKRTSSRHGFKFVKDNKLRGAYAETDFNTKKVRVNVKAHRQDKKRTKKKKNALLLDTLVHEQMHIDHPRMREKTVRRKTKAKVPRMGKTAKRRMYNKLKS